MADVLRQRAQAHLLALDVDALLLSKPESFTWATGAPAGVASLFRRAAAAMALVPTDASQPVAAVVTELFSGPARAALGDGQVRTHPDWVETADIRAGLEREPGASITSLVQKAHAASRRPPGFRRPAAFDTRIALGEMAALLRERGWTTSRIGLDMDFWPVVDFFALQDALPRVQWVDASAAVSAIKAVKSPREITCLTQAASLAEAGMRRAISSAKEGMTRDAIAAAWKSGVADEVHRTGAAINGQWEYVTVGPLPWQGGGTLGRGDVLKFDVGCLVDGYSSDSGRTFVAGAPGQRTRGIMDALEDAFAAGLEVLRPGCLLSDVHARASQAMHSAGFTTFSRGHFGHSLGRDTFCEMPPFIAAEAHVPIEPGMVLAFETPVYVDGEGGFIIEDQFLITEAGARPAWSLPRQLIALR